jgi:hypothetical protein
MIGIISSPNRKNEQEMFAKCNLACQLEALSPVNFLNLSYPKRKSLC